MADYASFIYIMRNEYIKKLEEYASDIMKEISDGKEELKLYYKSDIKEDLTDRKEIYQEYKNIFTRELDREKIVGSSLFGPHRDDLVIEINGKSARSFASQGQQRSIVLSLKLAEVKILFDTVGEYPVLLLDDVFSEIDENRQRQLLKYTKNIQTIIATPKFDSSLVKDIPINLFKVENGVISQN